MEPEARYTLIGTVVLGLALAAVLAVVWLSGSGRSKDSRQYTIVFERQSLEGLQVGGDVNMRGVKVGQVEMFTIARDNINRVKVAVRVDGRTPVSENTRAVVARNFLTGIARINLETPGTPGPELTRVPDGERHPVIPEGESGLQQIAESANRLALSGEEALTKLNALMSEQNQQAFGEALVGVRDLAVGLSTRLAALDRTLAGVDASARAFRGASERVGTALDRGAARLEPLTAQAETLLRDSRAAVTDLRAALGAGDVALRELARASRTLERQAESLGRRADDAADAGMLELRASAQELRRTAELLSVALERLAEPRSALIGPASRDLGPGEGAR